MSEEKSAGAWWGETATKIVVSVMAAGVLALGAWMFTMHTQLITLNVKLDQVTNSMGETKVGSVEAITHARSNARRIDKIENTRFTAEDAKTVIAPLERRLDALERKRRR